MSHEWSDLDPRIQAFLEVAPDAIVVVHPDGRIVAANDLTGQMFGYRSEEVLGHSVEMLVPTGYDARLAGRDLWGRRSNGDVFPVQISLSPVETEHGTFITSIIRDVTVQHQAEARFRGLLESAPDGIVVVDSSGTIVIVNTQTERMFGHTRSELLGQRIELLVPHSVRERHLDDRNSYLADPHLRPMGAGRTLSGRRKDGSEFPVEISLSPLKTDQGSLVMSIVRDITERRRAEELIQASLREKEAMLREIHHRVKNNLQVTSSLLRLQAGAIEDTQAREVFVETQNRIRSMALVHEKLYQSTDLSGIDFADYIRTLGDLLFKSFGVDPARIELEVTGGGELLSIDVAVPCGLIVNELLSNALKHAFPNQRQGRISVHVATDTGGARSVSVRDDGIGLHPTLNIDDTTTLGLQLVRGLTQQIDGTLEIERENGTLFCVRLPVEQER